MQPDRESRLPDVPRRRRRIDAVQVLARILCVLLALIGVMPLGFAVFVRSPWVQRWVERETGRVLREQGIDASYQVRAGGWPPAIELTHVTVRSSDGGEPFLTTRLARVRPKLFALLSGKLRIDEVVVESPRVRAVIRDGKLANLAVELPKSETPSGPLRLPFDVFSISDAELALDVDDVLSVRADEIDVDVTAADSARGSTVELGLHLGTGAVHRTRPLDDAGKTAHDDDAICDLEARVRWDGESVLVRRLSLAAVADIDPRSRSLPSCAVAATDKRRVDVSISRLKVRPPHDAEPLPAVDGHVRVRAPVALVERAAKAPDVDGWVMADVDVHYAPGMNMPDIAGHVEARDLRILQYRLGKYLDATVDVRNNVVRVPRATVGISEATVVLTDVQIEPLAKGMPLRAKAEIRDLSFAALMADLGVSEHSWVEWHVKEISVPNFAGTLDPLHLDADFTGHAPTFAVYDRGADNPLHSRLVRVSDTDIAAHLAIRPDSVQFIHPRVTSPKSQVQGEVVVLGFHGGLVVKVPYAKVDLAEIGPLGSVPIGGHFEGSVNLGPNTDAPELDAEASISDLVFGDMPLGNVSQAKAHLVTSSPATLTLSAVKAQKGSSPYEIPRGTLLIRSDGLVFDADVAAERFGIRDLLSIFHMEDDPRFSEIDGRVATTAQLHLALGGQEDKCGGGYVSVRAAARVTDANLYGERFEDGHVDFDLHWFDRDAGLAGADLDVSAFVLHKARSDNQGRPVGNVVGSATVRRGGALTGNAVLEGVPLSRIQTLAAQLPSDVLVEGSVSGVAVLKGTVDAFDVSATVDVTPIRVHGVGVGASHLRVGLHQFASQSKPGGTTRCGAPRAPPFDAAAYRTNTAPTGEIRVGGELFDGQIVVPSLTITQQKQSEIAGAVSFRRFDLGALAQMAAARERRGKDAAAAPPPRVEGLLTGDLLVDFFKQGAPHLTKATFAPRLLSIEAEGNRLALEAGNAVVRVSGGRLEVEPMTLAVEMRGGLAGAATAEGTVDDLGGRPTLDVKVDLAPINLGALVGIVPKVENATGVLAGRLRLTGPLADPDMEGQVTVRGGELVLPPVGVVSSIDVDLRADRHEIRVERATAKAAGGAIALTGHVPIHNLSFGTAELGIKATGLRFAPADGITVALDGDLRVVADLGAQSVEKKSLPRVTGDVVVSSFDYTRPMSLTTNLSSIGSARRTQVETYDVEADVVSFEVAVRAKQPLRIRNNVADVAAVIDSGTLTITGTNQRFGARGSIRALPGGHMQLPFGSAGAFDIRTAQVRFSDPTRIVPSVELQAVNEYRRGGEASSSGSVASYGTSTRGASSWRMNVHAYGDADDLKVELTSDPALSQEDIILLLTIGMTRAELDQLKGGVGAGLAFEALNAVSGASSAVSQAVPIVDDFRFGSAYSPRTGRTEPMLQVGKRLSDAVRADVATSVSEDRQLRANVQWRLSKQFSIQTSYDNVNVSIAPVLGGNVGLDLRWRLEFE
jgi:translocation and assembly module TamB